MKHKQEDEVIYGTALKTFSKFGYRKTTLEDIAGELGMTAAGIYAYASSKQELYEGTVRFAMHRWQEYVGEHIAKEKSARDKLIAMCRSALSYLTKDRQFLRLLEKDPAIFPMFPTADPYEDINSDSIRMISDILTLGMRTGEFRKLDCDSVSGVIFSMYKSFIIRAYEQGEQEFLNQNLTQTIDLLLHGIEEKGGSK